MNDKTLVALIGLIVGMLVCCCSGGVFMAAGSSSPAVDVTPFTGSATIEADVTEQYLNRTFMQNAAGFSSPMPLQSGQLDITPGNRMRFVVQVQSPLGEMTINGLVTLAAQDGQLVIHIADVRLGQLPVTALMQLFAPDMEAQINEQANKQLQDRTALANVTLVGVSTDDTQLRVFLTGK
jgi:hypothetical protein